MKITKAGAHTTLALIVNLAREAQNSKPRLSGTRTHGVLAGARRADRRRSDLLAWLLVGRSLTKAVLFARRPYYSRSPWR